eukprot:7827819-Alexandrium_andersonii.AAC.1
MVPAVQVEGRRTHPGKPPSGSDSGPLLPEAPVGEPVLRRASRRLEGILAKAMVEGLEQGVARGGGACA